MTTITCIAAWAVALLLLPVLILLWASEGRGQRIRRQRRQGRTWAWIAEHHHCSVTTARRWSAA
jgi:hypothetical protein